MLRILSVMTCFLATSASAVTISAGYKGQGMQNLMKSDGAVVNVRPIPHVGFSYSYNFAKTDLEKTLDSEDKFFNDVFSASSGVDVTEAAINRQLHEAQMRWYPMGGSFFMGAGAMAGTFTGQYSESWTSGSQVAKTYKGTTTYSSFAVGNIWEFKNIMLGAEWAGVSRNISNSMKVSGGSGESDQMSSSDKSFQEYLRLFTATDSISVLMVHLGVSL